MSSAQTVVVRRVRAGNFRPYEDIEIEPHRGLNLIVGGNAEGKTSLLEAIYVASRGRSFRAQNLADLCGGFRSGWSVYLESEASGVRRRVGVGWSKDGLDVRLDERREVRLSELVLGIPLQHIDPLAHRLVDEGPAYRRSFIDWGLFHVEQRFLEVWRRYQRALKQRNRALRDNVGEGATQAWNEELASQGELLSKMRDEHVAAVLPGLRRWSGSLLGTTEVAVELNRGWAEGEQLRGVLDRSYEQHARMGTTVQGPHRAELKINLADARAKGRVSRGQQKLLIAAMVLAQAELLYELGTPAPVILLDDFASELSPEFQSRLATGLLAYAGQKFVTAFEEPAGFKSAHLSMFHVEHGQVRQVVRG